MGIILSPKMNPKIFSAYGSSQKFLAHRFWPLVQGKYQYPDFPCVGKGACQEALEGLQLWSVCLLLMSLKEDLRSSLSVPKTLPSCSCSEGVEWAHRPPGALSWVVVNPSLNGWLASVFKVTDDIKLLGAKIIPRSWVWILLFFPVSLFSVCKAFNKGLYSLMCSDSVYCCHLFNYPRRFVLGSMKVFSSSLWIPMFL